VSDINYVGINENFPVAGQDNDTQVFRDNFDTIKNSLRTAQTEISDLQDNTARTDQDSDYNLNRITRAITLNNREAKWPGGEITTDTLQIEYASGSYQIFTLAGQSISNVTVDFFGLPGDPRTELTSTGMGRMIIEFYSIDNLTSYNLNFLQPNSVELKKDPDFPALVTVDSKDDPVLLEVWRHSQDKLFLKYLGKYSS